jgi:hypothetical protein
MMKGDIYIPVDRRGDDEAAVFLVVGRQVGSAPPKGDAERAAGD